MIDDLIRLITRLSGIITQETALLDALDLQRAGTLAADKLAALKALQGAYLTAEANSSKPATDEESEALQTAIESLQQASEMNRIAIEHGLALQMRLIQTIAHAVPRALAELAPIYQQDGSQAPPRPPEAFAFLSQM